MQLSELEILYQMFKLLLFLITYLGLDSLALPVLAHLGFYPIRIEHLVPLAILIFYI